MPARRHQKDQNMNWQFPDVPGDARCSYIEPEDMPLPYVYERLTAALDEPRAGDLIVIAKSYSHGSPGHLGSHGHPGVVQSRTPLIMAGAGVKAGHIVNDPEKVPKAVDIAPTVAYLMGLPCIDGANFSGLTSSQRGVPPDVILTAKTGRFFREYMTRTTKSSTPISLLLTDYALKMLSTKKSPLPCPN